MNKQPTRGKGRLYLLGITFVAVHIGCGSQSTNTPHDAAVAVPAPPSLAASIRDVREGRTDEIEFDADYVDDDDAGAFKEAGRREGCQRRRARRRRDLP